MSIYKFIYSLLLSVFSLVIFIIEDNSFADIEKPISVNLVFDRSSAQNYSESELQPTIRVGIYFQIKKGWHLYWRNSGEGGSPPKIEFNLPTNWSTDKLNWPVPEIFIEKSGLKSYGYKDETLIFTNIYSPPIIPSDNSELKVSGKVSWIACNEICVPGEEVIEKTLGYASDNAIEPSPELPLFTKYELLVPKDNKEYDFKSTYIDGFNKGLIEINSSKYNEFQFFPYKNTSNSYQDEDKKHLVIEIKGPEEKMLEGVLLLKNSIDKTFAVVEISSKNSNEIKESIKNLKELREVTTNMNMEIKAVNPEGLFYYILIAFLSGIILNFMPCIIPVISIKIFNFIESKSKGEDPLLNSISFSFGIVLSFLALATITVTLKSIGMSVGWGFQFQQPLFLLFLISVTYIFSLSLFGFYEINLTSLCKLDEICKKESPKIQKQILDGVIVTLLSTPCTAPFLGSAVAFALTNGPFQIYLIFLSIALGLATPFLLFTLTPSSLKFIPKPGKWMYIYKGFLGFSMLATSIWLITVYDKIVDSGLGPLLFILAVISFLLWLKLNLEFKFYKSITALSVCLCFVFFYDDLIGLKGSAKNSLINWNEYTEEAVTEAKMSGKTVFMDFTAAWCITCKANEYGIINTNSIARKFKECGVIPFKGDWTTGDPKITKALKSFGAEGVPLYVVSTKNSTEVLPTILTKDILLNSIDKVCN